jgi:hypothetical protein
MQDPPDEPVKLSSRLRTGAMTSTNCPSRRSGSNRAKRRATNMLAIRLGRHTPLGQGATGGVGRLPNLHYFSKMASSRVKVSANSSITRTQSATASRRGSVIASSQKFHAYMCKDGTPILESLSKFPLYQRAHLRPRAYPGTTGLQGLKLPACLISARQLSSVGWIDLQKVAHRQMILSPYSQNLDKNPANYQPLTPLTFLDRAAAVYPNHPAIIHGARQFTWKEFYGRCRRLASALSRLQIGPGDTVSVMLSNTPPMLEAHYAVPMLGAVLHSLNTRLDAPILAFQLDHADCKVLITDREFAGAMAEALALAKVRPIIIDYNDLEFPQTGRALSHLDYETLLANSDPEFAWRMPEDEWEAISLNYTSGTTGNPKGVVHPHRGAALMCYSNPIATGM